MRRNCLDHDINILFGSRIKQTQDEQSIVGRYRFASVASDSQICSQIGTDILAFDNGSAVDAAIATALCLGVVHIHNSGIGGGGFAVVYDNNKDRPMNERAHWFNFRETAPLAANETMFVDRSVSSELGGKAICVPGEIKAFYEMHKQFGKLPWKHLFQPAIQLAKYGFVVDPSLEKGIRETWNKTEDFPRLRNTFSNADGERVVCGDVITLPELANTLTAISNNPDAFYTGELAQDIISDLKEYDSLITVEDLQKYTVSKGKPLITNIKKYKVICGPPPSSGALVPYLLNIINGYEITSENIFSHDTSAILAYHRIIEAMKFAFAKRSYFGDAEFEDLDSLLNNITSAKYCESIRKLIDDDRTYTSEHYGARFIKEENKGTTHVSVLDADGNAVALTTSVNRYFGSEVVGRRTGISFNNAMDDFSTMGMSNMCDVTPSEANFIKPQKRPQSSMSPIIITDEKEKVQLVVGASGGTCIISGLFQVLFRLLFLEQSIGNAIDALRLHHQLEPNYIQCDGSLSEVIKNGLKAKGHRFDKTSPLSVCQAVHRQSQYIYAVTDRRKLNGQADGY